MHNRIEKKFRELKDNNQKALITFLTAGDPDTDTSYDVVKQMINNGIDIFRPSCRGTNH